MPFSFPSCLWGLGLLVLSVWVLEYDPANVCFSYADILQSYLAAWFRPSAITSAHFSPICCQRAYSLTWAALSITASKKIGSGGGGASHLFRAQVNHPCHPAAQNSQNLLPINHKITSASVTPFSQISNPCRAKADLGPIQSRERSLSAQLR